MTWNWWREREREGARRSRNLSDRSGSEATVWSQRRRARGAAQLRRRARVGAPRGSGGRRPLSSHQRTTSACRMARSGQRGSGAAAGVPSKASVRCSVPQRGRRGRSSCRACRRAAPLPAAVRRRAAASRSHAHGRARRAPDAQARLGARPPATATAPPRRAPHVRQPRRNHCGAGQSRSSARPPARRRHRRHSRRSSSCCGCAAPSRRRRGCCCP